MDDTPELFSVGGDCVRGNATKMQRIHADGAPDARIQPESALNMAEWLVVSIAVHDVSNVGGPLYFVGRQSQYAHDSEEPKVSGACIADYDEYFFGSGQTGAVTMKKGDLFVRHPLIWHSGTTNETGKPRYLPGLVFKASSVTP